MKKSEFNLLKVASKFRNKYAQSQNLQQIIEGAASYGENSPNGIMDFVSQLKQQKAQLSFDVEIKSGMMGGSSATVSNLKGVDSNGVDIAPQYAKLLSQVKNYLDKNLAGFPQLEKGTTPLNWDYRTTSSGYASNL